MTATTGGLVLATSLACAVEAIEATTIILAMGLTRGWRSTLAGVGTALVALTFVTVTFGYAITTWLPESSLQLVIGGLLLVFGLQWLRKAILRSSGRKALHDEQAIFQEQAQAARRADRGEGRLDVFAFIVAFKGTFLEGMEVVFIVITFGLNAHHVAAAVYGAAAAVMLVTIAAVLARRPLARVPENTMKYGVGLLLTSFGTFWAIEGLGLLRKIGRAHV